ncbi:MAG: hypothetical protein AB1644_09155 [Candidatus Zixiibacteriota bacterium]
MEQPTYATYWGGFRRASSLSHAAARTGELAWKQPLPAAAAGQVRHLFMWDQSLVVDAPSELLTYSLDGKMVLQKSKAYGSSPVGRDAILYYQDLNNRLTAINQRGETSLTNAYIPESMSNEFPVTLLVPRTDDFVAVVQYLGGPHGPAPQVYAEGVKYGDRVSIWEHEFDGTQALTPLFIPEIGQLVVFPADIVRIDALTGKLISRVPVPVENPVTASADAAGRLYVTGSVKGQPMMIALDLEGKELWRWGLPLSFARWNDTQPTIVGDDATVLAVTSNSIFIRKNESFTLLFESKDAPARFAARLADSSLLVCAGASLYHIAASGEIVYQFDTQDIITAAPVVASNGTVFIATRTELLSIR